MHPCFVLNELGRKLPGKVCRVSSRCWRLEAGSWRTALVLRGRRHRNRHARGLPRAQRSFDCRVASVLSPPTSTFARCTSRAQRGIFRNAAQGIAAVDNRATSNRSTTNEYTLRCMVARNSYGLQIRAQRVAHTRFAGKSRDLQTLHRGCQRIPRRPKQISTGFAPV